METVENPLLNLRKLMINHVHSVNRCLSVEYLEQQDNEILLANCHPTEREYYTKELNYCQRVATKKEKVTEE